MARVLFTHSKNSIHQITFWPTRYEHFEQGCIANRYLCGNNLSSTEVHLEPTENIFKSMKLKIPVYDRHSTVTLFQLSYKV